MTVYIEYVLINNFVIDYLMLKATFSLTGKSVSRRRLFFCAIFGAVIALAYPLTEKFVFLNLPVKIFSGFLIVLISGSFKNLRAFYINTAVFFGYTFLTGGAIIGIYSIFNIPYTEEISTALMVIPVYILLRLLGEVVKYVYRRKDIARLIYDVEVGIGNLSVKAKGFMDTGNGVYNDVRPVVICDKQFFKRLIGGDILKVKTKKITISTVTDSSQNIAIDLDYLKIYYSDEPNIYNNVTLAVSKNGIGDGYDIILHPSLSEDCYVEKSHDASKKVS